MTTIELHDRIMNDFGEKITTLKIEKFSDKPSSFFVIIKAYWLWLDDIVAISAICNHESVHVDSQDGRVTLTMLCDLEAA